MQAAAKSNLKAVSLELGGKSPLLIFDDADVEKAADLALLGILYNKVSFKTSLHHFSKQVSISHLAGICGSANSFVVQTFREKFVSPVLVSLFKKVYMMSL